MRGGAGIDCMGAGGSLKRRPLNLRMVRAGRSIVQFFLRFFDFLERVWVLTVLANRLLLLLLLRCAADTGLIEHCDGEDEDEDKDDDKDEEVGLEKERLLR